MREDRVSMKSGNQRGKDAETSIVQLPEMGNNKESNSIRCARRGDRIAYEIGSAKAGSKWQ